MLVERLEVEEGFLDGLDLQFAEGLNTLIGGRGTGKTSVIELIRYCLAIEGYTADTTRSATEHALGILGGGSVRLTLRNGDSRIYVARSSADDAPRPSDHSYVNPILLSQTEIENVALNAEGRLSLIDGFLTSGFDDGSDELHLISHIRSLTAELRSLSAEIDTYDDQLASLPQLEQELAHTLDQEKQYLQHSQAADEQQQRIDSLRERSSQLAVREHLYQRIYDQLDSWKSEIQTVIDRAPDLEGWPQEAGEHDQLATVRARYQEAYGRIQEAALLLTDPLTDLDSIRRENQQARLPLDQEARELRKEVETVKQGAGEISRRANKLRDDVQQLKALRTTRSKKAARLSEVRGRRSKLLDNLDGMREARFQSRKRTVERLTERLAPTIRVSAIQAAQLHDYESAIARTLKGSGIHYNDLAPALANALSPRELCEAAEAGDVDMIASAAGVSKARAARAATYIAQTGVEDILCCAVEDDIRMQLLDGDDYKNVDSLSIGQRCTVVLPIVMEHSERALIIDQPEDHLDNEFIVDTLIKALRNRSGQAQSIVSTHNANIPVLGESRQVTAMHSDGTRGVVAHSGTLDEPESVRTITTIMEGGADAFRRRAEFYQGHIPPYDNS